MTILYILTGVAYIALIVIIIFSWMVWIQSDDNHKDWVDKGSAITWVSMGKKGK